MRRLPLFAALVVAPLIMSGTANAGLIADENARPGFGRWPVTRDGTANGGAVVDVYPARWSMVAGDTLRRDRLVKARIYARAEIPEYWLFNLDEGCLEFLRDPDQEDQYRKRLVLRRDEEARSSAVPELAVPLADLFD